MTTLKVNIVKENLITFLGYLIAFFAPIKFFIIVIETFVFAEYLLPRFFLSKSKNNKILSSYKWLIKTFIFLFVILICRVSDIAFDLPISKIICGYIVLHEASILNSYLKNEFDLDLRTGIEKVVKSINDKLTSIFKL